MSLRARTTTGIGWTTTAKVAEQLVRFCLSIVLMRLLGPEAFGLIGMILVFSGFAKLFGELGFSSALVQRRDLREDHRSTVFWLNVALGAALTSILFLAAPAIAMFYGQPLVGPMAGWLSLCFLLSAPGLVPRALLQRALRFDAIAKVKIMTIVVAGVAAVASAAVGAGVWSLVVGDVVSSATASILFLALGGWRPRLLWSREALRQLFAYGAGLTGFKIINYWGRSADRLLIGKLIGAEALGIYSRASSLMLLPLSQLLHMLSPVMFPALASMQGDKRRVRRTFLRAVEVVTFVAFPAALGFVVVAEPFVLGLLGHEWRGVIRVSQILALVVPLYAISIPVNWIYTSQGRTDWMFWWGLAVSVFFVIAVVIGVSVGGIESVAVAYLLANVVSIIPSVVIPGRLIGMTIGDAWQTVRANLVCAMVMATLVYAAGWALPANVPPLAQLLAEVALGILIYAMLAYRFRRDVVRELTDIGRHIASQRHGQRTVASARPASAFASQPVERPGRESPVATHSSAVHSDSPNDRRGNP